MEEMGSGYLIELGRDIIEWLARYTSQPWTFYQLLILAIIFVVAWLLSRRIEPALEARARTIKGNPGLLRVIVAFMRRIEWVLFIVLTAIVREVMLETTWPSRSYLLSLALVLSFTWLAASVLTRIFHHRSLARFVALCVFIYVASGVLGVRDTLGTTLDRLAISLGDFRISALFVLRTLAVVATLLWVAHLAGRFFESRIAASSELSPSFKALAGKVVQIILTVIAGLIALNLVGIDLTALTIFSGALGVGLGFGLQRIISNFISGVIILADKSIKPGDTIELGDTFGWVRELRSRFVSVITRDGREYLIPNEDFITQQVVNWSYSDMNVRVDADFRVSYDCDPHEVVSIAIEAAQTVPRVSGNPRPVCWMTAFGAYSLEFKLRFWIADPQAGITNVRGQVLLALWDAFKEAGIKIPLPQTEILMRTPADAEPPARSGRKKG